MSSLTNPHLATQDCIQFAHWTAPHTWIIPPVDRQILRRLAGKVAQLVARPIEMEKRCLWLAHNSLQPARPVIMCDPENGWNEIFPAESLECAHPTARQWEFELRRRIFWGEKMQDDYTLPHYFAIGHIHQDFDWGVETHYIGRESGHAHTWEPSLKTEADLAKMHIPMVKVDTLATQNLAAAAADIFGDLLPVQIKTSWVWTMGMTRDLLMWRGLQQMLFDMTDNPDFIHQVMSRMSNGMNALLDSLEFHNLLYPNWDGSHIGSGGLGWTVELPQANFAVQVHTQDMWGFGESQETVGVSPRMFEKFVFQYQLPLLSRFGLVCYGCCEPLDTRWNLIQKIPRLRRVSISPWSSREHMAEKLGNSYIFSMKPNPADLAAEHFNEEHIRKTLRHDFEVTRGCCVEVIMKDCHTIRSDPQRVIRWVEIARQEAEALH
jgi:hypothetical protein